MGSTPWLRVLKATTHYQFRVLCLFQCNASLVLGMKKFTGVSMWSTTTHWSLSETLPAWVGVRTWNLPSAFLLALFTLTLYTSFWYTLYLESPVQSFQWLWGQGTFFLCGGNVMTRKQDGMSCINLRTYLIWILFHCNQVVGYITYKSSLCFQLILLLIKIQFLFLLFLFIIISRAHLKITHN